jgi:hypothetical protein
MPTFRIDSPDKQRVRLELAGDDGHKLSLVMSPKEAALMVAAVLEVCREIPPAQVGDEKPDWAVVRARTVSLGPSPLPDCDSLVLGFGDAKIAFALKSDLLRPMGESLLRMAMGRTNR